MWNRYQIDVDLTISISIDESFLAGKLKHRISVSGQHCFREAWCSNMDGQLSEVSRGRIIGMWESGVNLDEICQRIPCEIKAARRWINRWYEGGEEALRDRRRSNHRPRLTNAEEDLNLVRQVDSSPFLPLSDAINTLQLPISRRTATRRMHDAHVHCYRAAQKITLLQRHREDRVAFTLQELLTPKEDWDITIWTDEKVFCSADDTRIRVWRPDDHRLDPKYVVARDRSGRITCGMWGWISAHCPGELIEVSSHMNAEEYIDILENVLLPSVRNIYTAADVPTIRLVQDNSAVHTAHIVTEWFAQHPEIYVLNWPAKSPDLNLIENVWAQIVNTWVPGYERTRKALVEHAKNAWEELRCKDDFFANLTNSIPRRLHQVIERNGYWTDY